MNNEIPYDNAEHAFFCTMRAVQAKNDGARLKAGPVVRPGNGMDVEIVIKRLFQKQILTPDHIRVLRWYGKRELRPDHDIPKEQRAAILWDESMYQIGKELEKKGIIYGELTNG